MASISVRSGPPGSPTHPAQSISRRRNGLHDVDLNTFIAEEMALHLDSTANRKRGPAPCSDVITDSPTHKRNRMLWTFLTPPIPPLSSYWWPTGQLMRTDALANHWNLPLFHHSCKARNKRLLPSLTHALCGNLLFFQKFFLLCLVALGRSDTKRAHVTLEILKLLLDFVYWPGSFVFHIRNSDEPSCSSLPLISRAFFLHPRSAGQTRLDWNLGSSGGWTASLLCDSTQNACQRVYLILLHVFVYLTAELPLTVLYFVFAFEKAATVSLVVVQQWVCVCVYVWACVCACLWVQDYIESNTHRIISSLYLNSYFSFSCSLKPNQGVITKQVRSVYTDNGDYHFCQN